MNEMLLLEAIGGIDDPFIAAVWKRLEDPAAESAEASCRISRRPLSHRFSFVAAAVLLLLMSVFTMAMAFNEDFRSAVFRFLRISSPDEVLPEEGEPDPSGPIQIIGETSTEDAVNVQYIRIDGTYTLGKGGVIYLYDGETRENTAAYTVEEEKLHKLTPHPASLEYTWRDITYSIEFTWYEDDGHLYVDADSYDPETGAQWSVHAVDGSDRLAAVTLSQGSQIDYQSYPLLYDLHKKELLDPAAGCEALNSCAMTWIDFSEDASRLLIDCGYFDSDLYCFDTESRILYSLDELSGMHVLGAWFLDRETVCCISEDEEGKNIGRTVTFYEGDVSGQSKPSEETSDKTGSMTQPAGGACTEIFSSLPALEDGMGWGIQFTGGRYALLVEEDQSVYVMDLKTGEKAPIEGFTYPPEDIFTTRNDTGDKILYVRQDGDSAGSGLAVSEMGILDLQTRRFTVFAREGYETRYEGSVGWFDNDRIVIGAASEQGSYLYLFTLK